MNSYEVRIEHLQRYKKMAKNMVRSLQSKFTDEEALAAERCGHNSICSDCGMIYVDHPWCNEGLAKGLTLLCNGKLVKL